MGAGLARHQFLLWSLHTYQEEGKLVNGFSRSLLVLLCNSKTHVVVS